VTAVSSLMDLLLELSNKSIQDGNYLDSSIIDVIIMSNLTFLASKLGVPTINIM
jgi:hypothetical protein